MRDGRAMASNRALPSGLPLVIEGGSVQKYPRRAACESATWNHRACVQPAGAETTIEPVKLTGWGISKFLNPLENQIDFIVPEGAELNGSGLAANRTGHQAQMMNGNRGVNHGVRVQIVDD